MSAISLLRGTGPNVCAATNLDALTAWSGEPNTFPTFCDAPPTKQARSVKHGDDLFYACLTHMAEAHAARPEIFLSIEPIP